MKLVFIHGSGGTGRVWRYQTERFPDSMAITLPGHPDGVACETIEAAASWLRTELVGLDEGPGPDGLVLVGHSLGSAIALQYALDHPRDVSGLVLVGSGARLRVHPDTLRTMEQAIADPEPFERFFAESFRSVAPDFRDELTRLAHTLGPVPFLADLRACDRFDVVDRLGEIDAPTLAIVGTDDVMTPPKYSTFLEQRMPNASVRVIEGGTHFVFAEQPDAVNDAIAGFLDSLDAAR